MEERKQKKKMTDFEKARLIYTLELAFFTVVFVVLGVLFIVGIIPVADWKRIAFTYLTLAGGTWLTIDFIWALLSKKRRAKVSMIDKILIFPVGLALVGFDIYALVIGIVHSNEISETFIRVYQLVIGIDMLYLASVYTFEAIYHWFKPVPALLADVFNSDQQEAASDDTVEEPAKEETTDEKKQ